MVQFGYTMSWLRCDISEPMTIRSLLRCFVSCEGAHIYALQTYKKYQPRSVRGMAQSHQ